ncbi:hypothetical protein K525DRAFT_266160 [Schizophyllum commune Loenen D]|nr:hypothetical protein K525DRAFT_266160 [Schizophyllum commune Loenen D]
MGNRFSSIAAGNKDTTDRRPGPGPIRSTRSSKHLTSTYSRQSPKRAALERLASSLAHAITSHASSSSSSARVTRFRDVSPDTDSSNSDIEEGWDSHTTAHRSVYHGSDNAAHNERNQNATPPSCASTLSGPTRNSGAPSHPGAHCYTTFHRMPILSSPKVMSVPLDLRPIPACPTHSTSIRTSVHARLQAQTTALPRPCTNVSRESSPDYESLNPNTQGQAVAEVEEPVASVDDSSLAEPVAHHASGSDVIGFRVPHNSGGAVTPYRSPNDRWTIPSKSSGPPKIPKPAGDAQRPDSGGYNLQKALQLDNARYCAVRTKMNELVEAHLEPVSSTNQSEENVAMLTKEV